MQALHATTSQITQRIAARSAPTRLAYLAQVNAMIERQRGADRLGCANVAHAFAGIPSDDRFKIVAQRGPNIGVVNAYNDLLSAHAPYQRYPDIIKDEARRFGATAQVAGGVPAMCDGVTQGQPGMELSLFSRDAIAMATAISLSHDVFDAALLLGVCDKIVPGLLIGALHFGHLPTVFVPAGPMTSGLSNTAKSKVREQAALGRVGREELLAAESAAYHGQGTCTFYGTANSNQMLLEAMGLHVPGSAFVQPAGPDGGALREALTREAVRTVLGHPSAIAGVPQPTGGGALHTQVAPIGRLVDERCIVNAMAALLATGGSTNHLIHWVAVARAAGILIDWDDFSQLSAVTPLLARVYPNGEADVNEFQAAGGPGFVIRSLLDLGLMHADVLTVRNATEPSFSAYGHTPKAGPTPGSVAWDAVPTLSENDSVLRPSTQGNATFSAQGGLQLLTGPLGRAVIKVSAVPPERHVVQASARVFDSQEALLAAFQAGTLAQDVVCVVRFQGPKANGMPELHKLTPPLAVLQNQGFAVALVTDGRMSGASGKVPAAIHVSPEACDGGPLAKVLDGDIIRLDATTGSLEVLVDDAVWAARTPAVMPPEQAAANNIGMGRQLFAGLRRNALCAEEGACTWL